MSRRDREISPEDLRAAAKEAAAEVKAAARAAAADVKAAAAAYARELTDERLAEVIEARRSHAAVAPEDSIWMRPEPGARRARLTREEIARSALALADEEGIEAVSMRRVAAILGVGTMSLYHYVRTKAELVELMGNAMLAEVLLPEGEMPTQWRQALRAIATRTVASFHRHPWAIEQPPSTPGPNAMRHFEQSLEAVAGLEVDLATRLEIIAMVDDWAFGFVLREALDAREREAQSGEAFLAPFSGYVDSLIATGEFPHLEAVLGESSSTREAIEHFDSVMHDEGRFVRGLERLLDGIALELERDAPVAASERGGKRLR
jgi:AcrR family transcriptional regulator